MGEKPDPSVQVSTLSGVGDPGQARRSRRWRRAGVGLLLVVVVAACLGWLGPRDASASDHGVTVTFPQVTRAGMDSTIEVTLDQAAAGAVVMEIPRTVVDRLGIETISPQPSSEVSVRDSVRLTFEEPEGGFTVQLFGRLPPRAELGTFGYVIRVRAAEAQPREVSARTWVLP